VHEHVGKGVTLGEVGATGAVSSVAILSPVFVGIVLLGLLIAGILIYRHLSAKRVDCKHCGMPIRPKALVCPHCRKEQGERGVSS
jgi:hypothetical protein